jgi:hypothetical protein
MAEAIPLQGDRAARNAAVYPSLHANDIDASASSIHHTIGTGTGQVASGSHVHDVDISTISNIHAPNPQDGDVLTWSASTGSWIAYPPADWRVSTIQDTGSNDSDKMFYVPSDTEWQILWAWIEYTSSSVIGNRQLELEIQDSASSTLMAMQTGIAQSESLTYNYLLGISMPDMESPRDTNYLTTPLPAGTFLSEGQKLRVWDNKAIDSGGDDMIVRVQYAYRYLKVLEYYIIGSEDTTQTQTSDNTVLTAY